jgi:hypothetical protein
VKDPLLLKAVSAKHCSEFRALSPEMVTAVRYNQTKKYIAAAFWFHILVFDHIKRLRKP